MPDSLPTNPNADLPVIRSAGAIANRLAARSAFVDYQSRKSGATLRTHESALRRFADYLDEVTRLTGEQAPDGDTLLRDPDAWRGVSWGLVEGFRNWLVGQGDAVASVNQRLSIVKTYAKLAAKAGAIDPTELALIKTVSGYSAKEAKRVDDRRETTRRGEKKATHVVISIDQAKALKAAPDTDTPQGRRDALILALLLDHGLRVGEIAGLVVTDFNLTTGELRFYRPKVNLTQTHKLSADTLRAATAYFAAGDAPPAGSLLRGSRKDGSLTASGLSTRAISGRVEHYGDAIGLAGLSPHDCRHFWATFWADRVSVLRLQEAGGWSSLVMPRRYVEYAEIANEGMA